MPNDKQAPEIQGSRPQSFKDANASEAELDEARGPGDGEQARTAFNDVLVLFLGLCFLLTLGFVFVPDDLLDGWQPGPQTVEQRVNKILTDTPLIGMSIHNPMKRYVPLNII